MSFLVYLLAAAWQDYRYRAVSERVFLVFLVHYLTARFDLYVCQADLQEMPVSLWYYGMLQEASPVSLIGGASLGAVMMLLSRVSGGSLGMGDGIFFLISGIYLGFWRNLMLLCAALLLCSGAGLYCIVRGRATGRDCRKKRLPFLVFALIPGIVLAVG